MRAIPQELIHIILVVCAVWLIVVFIIIRYVNKLENSKNKQSIRESKLDVDGDERTFICQTGYMLASRLDVDIKSRKDHIQLSYMANDHLEVRTNLWAKDSVDLVAEFYLAVIKIAKNKKFLDGKLIDVAMGYLEYEYELNKSRLKGVSIEVAKDMVLNYYDFYYPAVLSSKKIKEGV